MKSEFKIIYFPSITFWLDPKSNQKDQEILNRCGFFTHKANPATFQKNPCHCPQLRT